MIDKTEIKRLSNKYFDEIVTYRRHLHKYPELSKHEKETSKFICNKLKEWGIEYDNHIYGYGIYGFIEGNNPRKCCIALRADMDALPIEEKTTLEYKSINKGVMHACGHDLHMSALLGTIKILNELKNNFEGRVMFIFQPSEEEYPGGAISMIKAGLFDRIKPEAILAFHCTPELPCGHIAIREGKMMASTDEVYIKIIGKGGHGATPHLDVDPIVAACHVVTALQTIVSRNANPIMPTTFSIGRFIAEGRTNIIPNEVNMDCIIRTFDENWRQQCHALIKKISQQTAMAFGCTADVFIDSGYPFVYNNPVLTSFVQTNLENLLGKDMIQDADMRMTAEDFAYFSQIIPACYFRLGTHIEGENIYNLHSSQFNPNENALLYAMQSEIFISLKYLDK